MLDPPQREIMNGPASLSGDSQAPALPGLWSKVTVDAKCGGLRVHRPETASSGRFLRYEFFSTIMPSRKVNRSQP